jgi:membrane-associated phospholipid phosphatase
MFPFIKSIVFSLLLVLCLQVETLAFSQTNQKSLTQKETELFHADSLKFNVDYIKSYWLVSKYIISSPARWKGRHILGAAFVLGGTSALYFVDQPIKDFAQSHQYDFTNTLFSGAEIFGNAAFVFPYLGINLLYGHFFNDQTSKNIALKGLQSVLISSIAVYGLKMSTQRHRPKTGDPYNTWDGPAFSLDYTSFPSGHSSAAWALATTVALEFKGTLTIPIIAYSLAGLTALSRVYENYHWSSDVFLGSAIGFLTARCVHRFHENKSAKNISLLPTYQEGLKGFYFSYRF